MFISEWIATPESDTEVYVREGRHFLNIHVRKFTYCYTCIQIITFFKFYLHQPACFDHVLSELRYASIVLSKLANCRNGQIPERMFQNFVFLIPYPHIFILSMCKFSLFQNFLIRIEMFVAAIAHWHCFSYKPFVQNAAETDPLITRDHQSECESNAWSSRTDGLRQ